MYKKSVFREISIKFILTNEEISEIENQKKYYENYRAISIEALKIVQKNEDGFLIKLFMLLLKYLKSILVKLKE